MIKKNIKKCALFCLTAVLACTIGVLINTPLSNVKGGTVSFEIENVQETNRVGTEINLADEITAEYNGSNVVFSKGAITFPSGKTYKVGSFKLTEVGNYSVKYYYQDGNVIVTAEKNFTISDSYYALTTNSGSITPVTAEEQKAIHESEGVVNGTALPLQSNADNVLLSGKDGLILRLKDGCQFIYNAPIDLSKAGDDGIAEIIAVNYRLGNLVPNTDPKYWRSFMFTSGVVPTEEEFSLTLLKDAYKFRYVDHTATRCKIRLTDAYNPNLYVELDDQYAHLGGDGTAIQHQNYKVAVSAAANGQILHGCRKGSSVSKYNVVAEIDGEQYMAYKNWNRATSDAAYLTSGKCASTANGTRWGYNYKTNVVYMKDGNKWNVVNDLDNTTIYPETPFAGFTTGEVFVSIYFTNYEGPLDARVDVLSIGEHSGEELISQYGQAGRVDFTPPEIEIDYDETDDGVIYAALGSEVELPSAFVKEVYSDGSYNVNVYTNYNTSYKKLVSVKNNKLKLVENTVYTVEYSATDASGQTGYATMNICPVISEKSIWVETTKLDTVNAGDKVKLPEYVFKTINNADKIKYSIKAVHEKETIIVDPETNVFIPKYTGTYKIIFEFKDNVYGDTFEYDVNSVATADAKFLTRPLLPKYVYSGETYAFEMLKGYIFSNTDVKEVGSEGYISVDGGEFTKIKNLDSYKITATDNIRIKFVNGNSESEIAEAKVIDNTVDVNGKKVFRLYKSFVGDYTVPEEYNASGRPLTSAIQYKMNKTEGDQVLSFANLVDYKNFVFEYKPGVETNYAKLKLVLTDVYDDDIKMEIFYYVKGSGHVVGLDDKEVYVNSAFANASATYTVRYDSAKNQMVVGDLVFDYDFSKFNTRLCYFDVVMEKVSGPASITVEKFGNHVYRGNKIKDDVAPIINIFTSDGSYEVGDKVTLNVPLFTDVISQIKKSANSVTIEHEDGTKIKVEDIYNPYEFTLEKLGIYSVVYATEDTAGVKGQYRYAITVVDKTAPEIEVNDYADDTMIVVKQGTLYKLNYTVTDNMSENEKIIVAVRMENLKTGEVINPSSVDELPCTIAGDYAVYIVAADEFMNFSSKVVYLRVEGGNK